MLEKKKKGGGIGSCPHVPVVPVGKFHCTYCTGQPVVLARKQFSPTCAFHVKARDFSCDFFGRRQTTP